MTPFLILGAVMTLAALAVLLWPILRRTPAGRRWPAALIVLLLPALSAGLYATWSNWDWQQTDNPKTPAQIERMLESLEARLQNDRNNVEGWLLLGRSYFRLGRFHKSADAYQQAYTLTQGGDVEALLGLGEALAFSDETMLTGRAAGLFERALQLKPDHPKALWYTGLVAYQTNQPAQARKHWSRLVELNPPDDIKQILNAKIAELDRRLQTAAEPAPAVRPTASEPPSASVKVRIVLAPELANKLPSQATLFVLARTGQGGPPLAVKKLSATGFPLTVELTDRDAMLVGRTLSSVNEATIVARISRSGAPQAQSGDLEGKLAYKFGTPQLAELEIDSLIP